MPDHHSIEARLLQVLAAIAVVAILGVLAILPYRLYARDIRNAKVEAHRLAGVVHTALNQALIAGEEPAVLVERIQAIADIEIFLSKLDAGDVHPAVTGHGTSRLSGTELTYTSSAIRDGTGGTWTTEMKFDLAPMKRESIRLIIDLVLAVIFGSAVFSAVIFLMVRRSLVIPLRELTVKIERRLPDAGDAEMPEFETREMRELVAAVERICGASVPHP